MKYDWRKSEHRLSRAYVRDASAFTLHESSYWNER